MKNIESDALLEYSADQLYEVIDDCSFYDMPTVLYVYGICFVDGFGINKNRISLLNQRVSETEFDSFQDYVNDLVNKKGSKDIAEYLDIVPEGHEDHVPQDETNNISKKKRFKTESDLYPTVGKLFSILEFVKALTWVVIALIGAYTIYSLTTDADFTVFITLPFLVYLLIFQFLLYLFQEFLKVFVDIGVNSNKTNELLKQVLESKDSDDRKRD